MHHDDHLDRALKSLGNVAAPSMSGDFMDGVWLRAGQMEQAAGQRRRLALPTYPFQRRRYWIDPPRAGDAPARPKPGRAALDDWSYHHAPHPHTS